LENLPSLLSAYFWLAKSSVCLLPAKLTKVNNVRNDGGKITEMMESGIGWVVYSLCVVVSPCLLWS